MISALAARELNAWKGERCSRLLAETEGQGSIMGTLYIVSGKNVPAAMKAIGARRKVRMVNAWLRNERKDWK